MEGFQNHRGLPGVRGAIDGSHIPIRAPQESMYVGALTGLSGYLQNKAHLKANCERHLFHTIGVYLKWLGLYAAIRLVATSAPFNNQLCFEDN